MIHIAPITFNPFAENTYLLYDETRDCVIIDPGCYDDTERRELVDFIADKDLKPVGLWNTHCHLDHIFGNRFVAEKWGLPLAIHREDLKTLQALPEVGHLYNLHVEESPEPGIWLEDGKKVTFGNSTMEVLYTPGHSRGSVCFYQPDQRFVICGDVLFQGSIGRSDLPGGDHEQLLNSIRTKLFTLPDDVVVYPGHGPATNILQEKKFNPFVGLGN